MHTAASVKGDAVEVAIRVEELAHVSARPKADVAYVLVGQAEGVDL